jgi:hypothetical protein
MWARPTKPLDQKMFWQNAALAFGVSIALRPAPWSRRKLGCGATIGARLDLL